MSNDGYWDAFDPRRRRARQRKQAARKAAVAAVAVALVVAGVYVVKRSRESVDDSPAPAAAPVRPAANKDPFADTDAHAYPVGAAGIVAPPARQVGGFTAGEVASALARTRSYLVEQNLDVRVLAGDVRPYYATLAPGSRPAAVTAVTTQPREALTFATRLAAGVTVDRAGARVKGDMTLATAVTEAGPSLLVRTNYVFAYPLRQNGEVSVVVVHRQDDLRFPPRAAVPPGAEGARLAKMAATYWGASCVAIRDGFLAPIAAAGDVARGRSEGVAAGDDQRFDPAAPMGGQVC